MSSIYPGSELNFTTRSQRECQSHRAPRKFHAVYIGRELYSTRHAEKILWRTVGECTAPRRRPRASVARSLKSMHVTYGAVMTACSKCGPKHSTTRRWIKARSSANFDDIASKHSKLLSAGWDAKMIGSDHHMCGISTELSYLLWCSSVEFYANNLRPIFSRVVVVKFYRCYRNNFNYYLNMFVIGSKCATKLR